MAGLLAGVETARRRRFYGGGSKWPQLHSIGGPSFGSGSSFSSFRRSSFCHTRATRSLPRVMEKQSYSDESLGRAAREAKERLDEKLRLRLPWKSEPQRANNREKSSGVASVNKGREMVVGELQTEVFGLKKSGSKRFNWLKMSWKALDQDECTVCLSQFKVGEILAHLPCAHRFHSRCLVPWLQNNAHCPCCRMVLAPNQNLDIICNV